jgi:hypothetical protein
MNLQAHESDLVGAWALKDGKMMANATARRIQWLIEHQLVELGADSSGWDALYRDPSDGRLWELTYPQSDSHGGGPPRLTCIDSGEVQRKYGHLKLAG